MNQETRFSKSCSHWNRTSNSASVSGENGKSLALLLAKLVIINGPLTSKWFTVFLRTQETQSKVVRGLCNHGNDVDVLLPDHPPEVSISVGEWPLRGDIPPATYLILNIHNSIKYILILTIKIKKYYHQNISTVIEEKVNM